MRTYEQLSPAEQDAARSIALDDLLQAVVEGAVRFNDKLNHDNLQARIDGAFKRAEKMQTPWFAGEYVMDAARDDLEGMASCDAEDAIYPDAHERVIRLGR